MKGTIFDLVETKLPEGQEGYFELAKNAPEPKDKSFLNAVKDYGKTVLKGTAEGFHQLGKTIGSTGITDTPQAFTEVLDEKLPTDEGYIQKSLRRGLKAAPTMAAFPGGALQSLPRSGVAGFLGQGAEELGLPEWAQTAAELTAYIGPDLMKKLLESGKDKEIIAFGREIGMSDEAITPLIQSEFKQKWLTKLSSRRGSTQNALKKSKSELDAGASRLEEASKGFSPLTEDASIKLGLDIENVLFKMPAEIRGKITHDWHDLLKHPITADSLMNFWRDINHTAGANSKQLSLIKPHIKQAISDISPQLGKDFEMLNTLYTKYYPIAKRLEPNLMSDLIGASESLALLGSIWFGAVPYITKFAGEKAGRKLAQQMLTNPRFQQISKKMVNAFQENKFGIFSKLVDLLGKETEKYSPEAGEKIRDISDEELEYLFKSQQK